MGLGQLIAQELTTLAVLAATVWLTLAGRLTGETAAAIIAAVAGFRIGSTRPRAPAPPLP